MTTEDDWPGEVCHCVEIRWDLDANGHRVNPQFSLQEFYISGLKFRYRVALSVNRGDWPHNLLLELVDPRMTTDFDDHWSFDLEYRYNAIRLNGGSRTFRSGQLLLNVFRMSSWTNPIVEWRMKNRDIHPYKSRFVDQAIAVKHGNEHQVTLTADNNTIVHVNKDLICLDSPFFTKLFAENQNPTNLDEVTTADFLDYVYCVHPPVLNLTLNRIENIMKLAKRFGNQPLMKTCKDFLEAQEPQSSQEKCRYLYCADAHEMPELFSKTLTGMTSTDLQIVDPERIAKFHVTTTQQLLTKFIKTICPFELQHLKSSVLQHIKYGFLFLFFGFFIFLQFVASTVFEKARHNWKLYTSPYCFLWNRRLAKERGFDCTIFVEGEENSPLFVMKAVLATNSAFFKTHFKEGGKNTLRLGGLKVDELLEYLKCVYPSGPKEEFTYKQVATILRLADRFQNESLVADCEEMLNKATCDDPKDAVRLLEFADERKMPQIFEVVTKSLRASDLCYLNIATTSEFREESVSALLQHLIALLP